MAFPTETVHLADAEDWPMAASSLPEVARRLLDVHAPGPLTVVLPKRDCIAAAVTAGLPTVAIRVPANPVARELIRRAGCPVAAPSANRSGRPSATTWQAVLEDLDGRIDAVVCDNPSEIGVESTVVDCGRYPPVVLRRGAVTGEQIASVAGAVEYLDRAAQQELAEDYRIGARDLLEIRVFDLEELDSTVRVSEDGRISLPMIGELRVLGLTRSEVETAIESALKRFVNDPQVSVFVREFESQRVSVLGAVKTPGTYPMQGRMTLLEAISEAGGIDYDEASGTVAILRHDMPGEPIEISLEELISKGNTAFNVELKAGDTVNVVPREHYFIYVQGAVRNPGSFRVNEPITVLQAIALAGGLGERAKRTVLILRTKPEGGQEQIKVNLNDIMDGKAPDVPLQPKDVVVVQESFF